MIINCLKYFLILLLFPIYYYWGDHKWSKQDYLMRHSMQTILTLDFFWTLCATSHFSQWQKIIEAHYPVLLLTATRMLLPFTNQTSLTNQRMCCCHYQHCFTLMWTYVFMFLLSLGGVQHWNTTSHCSECSTLINPVKNTTITLGTKLLLLLSCQKLTKLGQFKVKDESPSSGPSLQPGSLFFNRDNATKASTSLKGKSIYSDLSAAKAQLNSCSFLATWSANHTEQLKTPLIRLYLKLFKCSGKHREGWLIGFLTIIKLLCSLTGFLHVFLFSVSSESEVKLCCCCPADWWQLPLTLRPSILLQLCLTSGTKHRH